MNWLEKKIATQHEKSMPYAPSGKSGKPNVPMRTASAKTMYAAMKRSLCRRGRKTPKRGPRSERSTSHLSSIRRIDAALTLTITIKLSGKRQQSHGKHPQNIVRGSLDDGSWVFFASSENFQQLYDPESRPELVEMHCCTHQIPIIR